MAEANATFRRVMWKLLALLVLTVGTIFVATPPTGTAQSSCQQGFNVCQNSCPCSDPLYDVNYFPTCARDTHCVYQCVDDRYGCLETGGIDGACDSIWSTCQGLTGTDIGGCYGDYAACTFQGARKRAGMITGPVPESNPCLDQASNDKFACMSGEDPAELCFESDWLAQRNCCFGVYNVNRGVCFDSPDLPH
jgi:hypothetical protein